MIVNVFDAMKRMREDAEGAVPELLNGGHGMSLGEEANLEVVVVENQIGLNDEQTKMTQMNVLLLALLMKTVKLLKLWMDLLVDYL